MTFTSPQPKLQASQALTPVVLAAVVLAAVVLEAVVSLPLQHRSPRVRSEA